MLKINLPQYRGTGDTRLAEGRVPYGKQLVAQSEDIAKHALVRLIKQIRLAALRVNMRMCPEEREERAQLVPPH